MTDSNIVLLIIIWVLYGVLNVFQNNFFLTKGDLKPEVASSLVILFAPIVLLIRLFKGLFIWNGEL